MSEDDKKKLSEELEKKIENPDLAHVETKATEAEMILKLKKDDGSVVEFPMHCDIQMDYVEESNELKCSVCGHKEPSPGKPFISKA
ncbi:MAG: hypothetical protein ACXAEU_12775 [Candidatus Hodarchaeales archaeon]|jgi:hypothetical protein